MNIFNRREIFMTMDLQKFSQVTNILDNANIKYTTKIFNTYGVKVNTVEAIGVNSKYMSQYYIYVHKKDYDQACIAIRNIKLF
jgi:hypothetical protein